MARYVLVDLLRLDAIVAPAPIGRTPLPSPLKANTIVVHNTLAAPIFILFGAGDPSAAAYDLVVPAKTLFVHPLAPTQRLSAVVVYPGAVPAGDVGQQAIIRVTSALFAPFVGPLTAT